MQVAEGGYVLLPSAIGATADTFAIGLWVWLGPADNVLSAYCFMAASVVGVFAGGWAFKEKYWPSRRRAPQSTSRR